MEHGEGLSRHRASANSYKIMHVQSALHYEWWYNCIMIMGIFMGPLASLMTTVGGAVNSRPANFFDIASSVIAFVSGVVVGILKFGKFDQVATSHKNAAFQYATLEGSIRKYNFVPEDRKSPFYEFTEYISNSLDALLKQAPSIPNSVIKRYVSLARKKHLQIPSELMELDGKGPYEDAPVRSLSPEGSLGPQRAIGNKEETGGGKAEGAVPSHLQAAVPQPVAATRIQPIMSDKDIPELIENQIFKGTVRKTPSYDRERIDYEVARLGLG